MNYVSSSQRSEWTFSRVVLDEMYEKRILEANERLETPLKLEDARVMLLFYEKYILDCCERMSLRYATTCTAIVYFKRFCLSFPLLRFPLDQIALTCIFLSGKVEEEVDMVALRRMQQLLDLPPAMLPEILRCETAVLSGIKYSLLIFEPMRTVTAIVGDKDDTVSGCWNIIRECMLSDCPFLFSPALLALFAISKVIPENQLAKVLLPVGGDAAYAKAMEDESRISSELEMVKSRLGKLESEREEIAALIEAIRAQTDEESSLIDGTHGKKHKNRGIDDDREQGVEDMNVEGEG